MSSTNDGQSFVGVTILKANGSSSVEKKNLRKQFLSGLAHLQKIIDNKKRPL
jgi:hypothetical protein